MKTPFPPNRFRIEQQKRAGARTWVSARGHEPPQSVVLPDSSVHELAFQQSRFPNPFVRKLLASKKTNGIGIGRLWNHEDLRSGPEDVRVGIVASWIVQANERRA